MKVYVMLSSQRGLVKVGISANPERRAVDLGGLDLVYTTASVKNARAIERVSHMMLMSHVRCREWFAVSVETAIAVVRKAQHECESGNMPITMLNDATISVRLETSVKRALQRLADKDQRTLSQYVVKELTALAARRAA